MGVYGNDTMFVHTKQDVWHACGITESSDIHPNVEFVTCRDCGHCSDVHTYGDGDAQQLKDTRQREVDFMNEHLDSFWDK